MGQFRVTSTKVYTIKVEYIGFRSPISLASEEAHHLQRAASLALRQVRNAAVLSLVAVAHHRLVHRHLVADGLTRRSVQHLRIDRAGAALHQVTARRAAFPHGQHAAATDGRKVRSTLVGVRAAQRDVLAGSRVHGEVDQVHLGVVAVAVAHRGPVLLARSVRVRHDVTQVGSTQVHRVDRSAPVLGRHDAVVAVRLTDRRIAVSAVVVRDTLVGRVRAAPVERVLVRRDLTRRVHHLHAVTLVNVDAAALRSGDGGAEVRGPVLAVESDAAVVSVPPDHVDVRARLARRRRAGRRQLRGPRFLRAVVANHVHVVAGHGGAWRRATQVAGVTAVEGASALSVSRSEDHEAVLVGVDVSEVVKRDLDGGAAGHELVVSVKLTNNDAVTALEGDARSATGDSGDGDELEGGFVLVGFNSSSNIDIRDLDTRLGAKLGVVGGSSRSRRRGGVV
ncbi:hypothetical protein GQ600_26112 [Phytophthora cactorum]|nr:hypothetical protein GQ600_26112 [Phytophthora cactorum]